MENSINLEDLFKKGVKIKTLNKRSIKKFIRENNKTIEESRPIKKIKYTNKVSKLFGLPMVIVCFKSKEIEFYETRYLYIDENKILNI